MSANNGGFGFGGNPRPARGLAASSLLNGLSRYYALNGNANDAAGGAAGAITGPSPTYQAGKGAPMGSQALYLGGSSSNKFKATSFGGGDFSVSFWIYPRTGGLTAAASYCGIIGNMAVSTIPNDWFFLAESGLDIRVYDNANGSVGDPITLTGTSWNNIVLTRTAGTAQIYRAGVSYGASFSLTPSVLSASQFYLNCRSDARETNARMQQVGLWNRAITPAEIANLYNTGAGVSYPF